MKLYISYSLGLLHYGQKDDAYVTILSLSSWKIAIFLTQLVQGVILPVNVFLGCYLGPSVRKVTRQLTPRI